MVLIGTTMALTPALAPAQISLVTVVDLAQRNSSAVRIAQADVDKAGAALAQTKDVFVPVVMFGSGLPFVPSVGFTGGVPSILNATVQSLVFSIPEKNYIKAADLGRKAASLSLKDALEQTALEASTTYIELDTVTQELNAASQQESYAARLVEIEQQRAEAGVDPLSDLLQAQLSAAQLKLTRLHLETRSTTLSKEISVLTGLPVGAISPDHVSIPEIPSVRAGEPHRAAPGIESALMLAHSKQQVARGDIKYMFLPQISLAAEYLRSTQIWNDADSYYSKKIPPNNFSSGFSIQVPIFDWSHRDKAKQSAAEALRAKVEAEQAGHQNDIQVATLTGNLLELDTQAEIASLKQQIANEQLKSVLAQLELGNGAGSEPGAAPQQSPKAEQLARIDERQKYQESLDAALDLAKARLNLLRALGHMEDWLHELHAK
jgi:outer membrane protein TolC